MFKLWKNPCGPFPFCISVKKWDVCRISAVVGCHRCLQNNVLFTCAARLGILSQPMLPVLSPRPDPSGILQTGQVPPPPVVRGCRCLLGESSLPTALCRADPALCKEFPPQTCRCQCPETPSSAGRVQAALLTLGCAHRIASFSAVSSRSSDNVF